jgi:hypothetical protein
MKYSERGEYAKNEYIVGDIIGEYEVIGIIGRGLIYFYKFKVIF